MMGSTLAANLSASAFTASTAFLRATWSLGLPRVTPRDHAPSWDRRYAPADLARTTARPMAGIAPIRPSGDSGVAWDSSATRVAAHQTATSGLRRVIWRHDHRVSVGALWRRCSRADCT